MTSRLLLIAAVTAGLTLAVVGGEASRNVRLEMWTGCLCLGPDHYRTYEQLKAERAERMLFGTNVTVRPTDRALAPLPFLKLHLADCKLKDQAQFYRLGVTYRREPDAQSYGEFFRGPLRKLKMSDVKDGDLILYYKAD